MMKDDELIAILRTKAQGLEFSLWWLILEALRRFETKLREQEQSKWISVSERLPEPGKVLVTDGKSVRMTNGAWFYRASDGETRAPANYGAGITVTHWMPLPEPPTERETVTDCHR